MLTDMFLCWVAGAMCLTASLERPDRRGFWLLLFWHTAAAYVLIGVTNL